MIAWNRMDPTAQSGDVGELTIAMVVLVKQGAHAGEWRWQVHGVRFPPGRISSGWQPSEAEAITYAERAWARWLQLAGLAAP